MFALPSSRRHAFTLLEVLLVVGIIVLLILAVIPAFRPRQTAPKYELRPRKPPAWAVTPTPAEATPAPAKDLEPAPAEPEPAK